MKPWGILDLFLLENVTASLRMASRDWREIGEISLKSGYSGEGVVKAKHIYVICSHLCPRVVDTVAPLGDNLHIEFDALGRERP